MNVVTRHETVLNIRYLDPESYLSLTPDGIERPLAAVIHGDMTPPIRPWPQVLSPLRPLSTTAQVEVLFTTASLDCSKAQGFDLTVTGDFLFGVCPIQTTDQQNLTAHSEQLYSDLLQVIRDQGYPQLLRIWNIIPDINVAQDGLERYRQFCLGRHEALMRERPDLAGVYPAASAVGSHHGGLCIYFLAAKTPGLTIENPRQVSAYNYPTQYGPRSPSFSRALVKRWGAATALFLSGTASITGHESRHVGALVAQVEESIENLKTLIHAAADSAGVNFELSQPCSILKAYLRHADDYSTVKDILNRRLGDENRVLYLHADLCRNELLFEIDGILFS